jgi:hypothetical protein
MPRDPCLALLFLAAIAACVLAQESLEEPCTVSSLDGTMICANMSLTAIPCCFPNITSLRTWYPTHSLCLLIQSSLTCRLLCLSSD